MQDKTEWNPTTAEVQKLQEENRRLIAYTEELEFETSRNYCRLTNEIRDLKAANRDLSQKYEFSDSHYQMTLRHADNLQAILDDSKRTICDMQKELNYRDLELLQARRHADNLQKELNYRDLELLQLRSDMERLQNVMKLQNEELQQTRRHAQNLQKMQDTWDAELLQARRHADNLQQALDAKTQESLSAKLHRAKERVRKWVK